MLLSERSTRFSDGRKVPPESLNVPFCDKPWLVNYLLANGLEHAYHIKWHSRLNRWWLIVLVDLNKVKPPSRCVDQGARVDTSHPTLLNVVALDPGVRTFQTTYDASGHVNKLCVGLGERIKKLCQKIDARRSGLDKKLKTHKQASYVKEGEVPLANRRARQSRRNQIRRGRYSMHTTMQKVCNTVKWSHWECVNFLFRRYDTVLIPVFKTKSMLPTLASKVARAMATLSHYSFRQRLLSRKEEDVKRDVFVTREPGTSRTCCLCGHWNVNLGGGAILSCIGCGAEIDRDTNGAVGNLLAYLTDGP
jgi:transposase